MRYHTCCGPDAGCEICGLESELAAVTAERDKKLECGRPVGCLNGCDGDSWYCVHCALLAQRERMRIVEAERDRLRAIVRHCERRYGKCWEVCPVCGDVNDADKEHNCGSYEPVSASTNRRTQIDSLSANHLRDALNSLMQAWDEQSVPEQGRVFILCQRDHELLGSPRTLLKTPVSVTEGNNTCLTFDLALAARLRRIS